jgi:hypothetical protein
MSCEYAESFFVDSPGITFVISSFPFSMLQLQFGQYGGSALQELAKEYQLSHHADTPSAWRRNMLRNEKIQMRKIRNVRIGSKVLFIWILS